MLFTELRFLPFFLLAFLVHWGLGSERARKLWLLLASYVFYAAWDWRFLSLIALSTAVDYAAGLGIARGRHRRGWLLTSLLANLGMLGVFKYCGFFVDSAAALLGWLGFEAHLPTLQVVLPVGISFYTFQTLSYTIDVHRGRLRPTRDLPDLALFVAFFPQLVAGPIVRAADFLPQLERRRSFTEVDVRGALLLFWVGFVKKACISDNVAPIVDAYFANPTAYDVLGVWAAVTTYSVQIYCDFSGYSDMAIACAALLGFRLCLNFHFPFLSSSPSEFWRRWHISLSSWLRDYLYVPLGGNRRGPVRQRLNLMLTMLLGGLWHGAAWSYVLWGGLHGLGLVLHRAVVDGLAGAGPRRRRLVHLLGFPVTVWMVCLGWTLFRAEDFSTAQSAMRAFVLLDTPGETALVRSYPLLAAVLAGLLLVHVAARRRLGVDLLRRLPGPAFGVVLGLLVVLSWAFVAPNAEPFLYFQF